MAKPKGAASVADDWRWFVLAAAVFAAIYAILFLYSAEHPACGICDAQLYGVNAASIQQRGLFGPWSGSDLRTYGYPAFLALIMPGADWTSAGWALADMRPALVQGLLFLGSVIALFWALRPLNRPLAWCFAVGLLCNPFVLVHLPIRLTEGVAAPVFIILLAIAARLAHPGTRAPTRLVLFALGGLLAGFAMEIRPAFVSVLGGWLVFCAIHIATRRDRATIALLLATAAGIAIALAPQIAINLTHYATFSPFPSYDLSGLQVGTGVRLLKYGTDLSRADQGQIAAMFYVHRYFDLSGDIVPSIATYFAQPWAGLRTFAGHTFHALNYDYFFTYNYARTQWAAAPANAVNHALLLAALGGAAAVIRRRGVGAAPLWWFAGAAVLLTIGVNGISTPETRFGLIVFCIAGPLGLWQISRWWAARRWLPIGLAATLGIAVAVASATVLPGVIRTQVVDTG